MKNEYTDVEKFVFLDVLALIGWRPCNLHNMIYSFIKLLIFPGPEWRGALEWEVTEESDVRHSDRVDQTELQLHHLHYGETPHIGPQPPRLVWREAEGDQTDRTKLRGVNSSLFYSKHMLYAKCVMSGCVR